MADQTPDSAPEQTKAKPKRSLPWGYLVMAVLVLGAFITLVVAPDVPRGLFGGDPPKPEELGQSPARAGDVSGGGLSERELAAEMAALGQVKTRAAPAAPVVKQPEAATTKPVVASDADEGKAAPALAEAEKHLAAMEWDRAESAARRVLAMKTRNATRNRAVDIARVAPGLKRVFKDLDERDELNRNWETHPSLVRLVRGGSETLAVPILGLDAPYQPVLDDPVGHVQRAAQAGKVMLLVKGAKQFTPAEMDVVDYNILPADQAAMRADAQQGLSARLARVQADKAAQRDAFVWYELGKFAYRNRLDDQVVKHLEKAVDLDPFLARSVREANAGILFGSLVAHMKNGNKAQAAAFMASIERRFKDTEQGKQARLYYQGETSKLVELAKEAARREKEEAEARKRELAERARQKGDEAVAKQIEEAPAEEPAEPAGDDSGPVAAEIATARELRDKGAKLLGEAVNMPATDARNHKYSEAAKTLAKAKASYAAYLEKNPTDSSAEAEFIETNKMWFTANKMKTL